MGDQRTPVLVSAATMVSNLLIGLGLMRFGVAGLAFTLSLSSFIQTGLLVFLLKRKIGDLGTERFVRPWFWQVLLSGAAAFAAYGTCFLGDWPQGLTARNVAVLTGALAVAVVIYGGGALALKLEGVDQSLGRVLRKLKLRR